jgi:hypothetical protein
LLLRTLVATNLLYTLKAALGRQTRAGTTSGLGVWPLELQCERSADLQVAQQEGALVESLAPQPAGDFGVALTGVA